MCGGADRWVDPDIVGRHDARRDDDQPLHIERLLSIMA
jgi:hypothetical protein